MEVSISSPATGVIIRRTPVEDDGSFTLPDLPGGVWNLGCLGVSSTGQTLLVVNGTGPMAFDSANVLLPAPLKVVGASSLIVHVLHADPDWTFTNKLAENLKIHVESAGVIRHEGVSDAEGMVIFDLGSHREEVVLRVAGHPAVDSSDPMTIDPTKIVSPQPFVMAVRK